MATSGSTDFTVSRNDVLTEALELVGALGEGETPNSDQITSVARTLNMMMKAWQSKINLFAIDVFYQFLDKTSQSYSLPSASGEYACRQADYIGTTTSAAHGASVTTINLTSIAGMAVSDKIGVKLDDGTMHWSTISSIGASSVVIATGLASASATASTVHTYTTAVNRPMKVSEAHINTATNSDINVDVLSRDEYYTLPDKTSTGQVNQVYFDPQTTTAKLYVWPVADNASDFLKLIVLRTIEDVDADDDVDFPQEWYMALSYNLAKFITPKYGVPTPIKKDIKQLADELYRDALDWDVEYPTSIYIQPDKTPRHG